MATLNFNAAEVPPAEDFGTIPPGKYPVAITASEMRPTKDGNGQYLWLEMTVTEGEFGGRKLWDRLNIQNANQQASEIAYRTLSAICHAVGRITVSDSSELHDIPLTAIVAVQPATAQYAASNVIKGYSAYAPASATAAPQAAPKPWQKPAQSAPQTQPATAAKPAGAMPWRKTAA